MIYFQVLLIVAVMAIWTVYSIILGVLGGALITALYVGLVYGIVKYG